MTGGAGPEGARGPGPGLHQFVVEDGSGARLDLLIAARLDLSRTGAATLIANGSVTVDGRREKASYRPATGERVAVDIPPPPDRPVLAEDIPLAVVWEDEHALVVDKPAGMVVHPAPGNWTGTLVNALKGRGQALAAEGGSGREGILHRLDKETSGLLLVAKTDRALRWLGAALAARRIKRRYAALAWGHLGSDRVTVDKPVARDPRDRKRMAIVNTGKAAKTDFVRLARFDSADLLRAHLHTGRTHQIRVHLASIGHPVLGDDTYGGGGGRRLVALPPKRHFLHAAWLRFAHPVTGADIDVRSALPNDLRAALVKVGEGAIPLDAPDPLELLGFYNVET